MDDSHHDGELDERLRSLLSDRARSAGAPSPLPPGTGARVRRRQRLVVALASVFVVGALAVGVAAATRGPGTTRVTTGTTVPSPSTATTQPAGDQTGIAVCQKAIRNESGATSVAAGYSTTEAGLYAVVTSFVSGLTSTVPLPGNFASSASPLTLCYFDGAFPCPGLPGNPDYTRVYGYVPADGRYRNIACGTSESMGLHAPPTLPRLSTTPRGKAPEPLLTVHVADPTRLDVTFRLPTCEQAVGYVVTDESESVVVTVYSAPEYVPGGRCIGGLGQGWATIELPHPLADRHLVDGACLPGMDLSGSTDCATGYTRN